jgi:hypothetical protein
MAFGEAPRRSSSYSGLSLVDGPRRFIHFVWGTRRCRANGRILRKNCALQRPKLVTRFDTKLSNEHVPEILIGGERIRLSAVTVEREHQLTAPPLTQRLALHSSQQLSNDRRMTTEKEIGVDKVFKHGKAQLRQVPPLRLRPVLVKVDQGIPAPARQGVTKRACRGRRIADLEQTSPVTRQLLETMGVERIGRNMKQIPR